MSIKTQGSKIIRNLAGEILTESDALIDLRSTYGVIKSVGSEVDKITFYYKPIRFTNNNSNCVENGDGLNFTGNTAGYFSGTNPAKNLPSYYIGFWIKFDSDTPTRTEVVISADVSGSSGWQIYHINGNMNITWNGVTGQAWGTLGGLIPSEWNYYSAERDDNSGQSRLFINGVSLNSNLGELYSPNDKLYLGNKPTASGRAFTGFLDDILIYSNSVNPLNESIGSQTYTPPKRSSDNE